MVLYKLASSINLEAPSTTLSGIAAVKFKPLKNLRPSGPSTLTPQKGVSSPYYTTNFPTKKEADGAASFLYVISGQPDKP